MTRPRWSLPVVGVLLALPGCTPPPGSSTAAPAASPTQDRTEAEDVRIDLGPAGMAATIVAPRDAHAHATPDGVELRGGDGFHLLVERGPLDPLVEKARIVREYQDGFRRFVADRGREVVYEVSSAGEIQFHFFLTHNDAPIAYHCRTPDRGVPSLDLIERMIGACRQVRHRAEIEPTSSEHSPMTD